MFSSSLVKIPTTTYRLVGRTDTDPTTTARQKEYCGVVIKLVIYRKKLRKEEKKRLNCSRKHNTASFFFICRVFSLKINRQTMNIRAETEKRK